MNNAPKRPERHACWKVFREAPEASVVLVRDVIDLEQRVRELRDKVATYIEDARYYHRQWRAQAEMNVEAVKQIRELREALEWYADPANTTPEKDGFGGTITNCECDEGERARAVLDKYREDT